MLIQEAEGAVPALFGQVKAEKRSKTGSYVMKTRKIIKYLLEIR